jgi:hypothetical protein
MSEFFFDVEQRSPEWYALRCGIPTCSRFSDVLAGGQGKVRGKYMRQLAGEIITGEPAETYSNSHMERGRLMEAQAREQYARDIAFVNDEEVREIGFIRNTKAGGSPDALVGEHGILEIKTMLPDLLIEKHQQGGAFPPEHIPQCSGNLWVSGRQWCDLVMYWPKMPLFIWRLERNASYIEMLAEQVELFAYEARKLAETLKLVEWIKQQ